MSCCAAVGIACAPTVVVIDHVSAQVELQAGRDGTHHHVTAELALGPGRGIDDGVARASLRPENASNLSAASLDIKLWWVLHVHLHATGCIHGHAVGELRPEAARDGRVRRRRAAVRQRHSEGGARQREEQGGHRHHHPCAG